MRKRLLDLYCGAGYAAKGYADAGFEVVGVDIKPQPNYPFEFRRYDARFLPRAWLREFHGIHASPPCQFGTVLRHAPGGKADHPNLIPETREMLRHSGIPYVIENVAGSRGHLVQPVELHGGMFGLGVGWDGVWYQLKRSRFFECSFPVSMPPMLIISGAPVIGIYGGHVRNRSKKHGGRGTADFVGADRLSLARQAMGADWGTLQEMSQGIPPAYTKCIGRALMRHLESL